MAATTNTTTEVTEKKVYHLADMESALDAYNHAINMYTDKFTRKTALELRKSLLIIGKICDAGRKEVQDAVKAKYGETEKEEKVLNNETVLPVKAKSVKKASDIGSKAVETVKPPATKKKAAIDPVVVPAPVASVVEKPVRKTVSKKKTT